MAKVTVDEFISRLNVATKSSDEVGLKGQDYLQYRVDVINTELAKLDDDTRTFYVTAGNRGMQIHVKLKKAAR